MARRRFKRGRKRKGVSKAVKRWVKKEIAEHPELKMAEVVANTTVLPNSGVVDADLVPAFNLLLNGLAQGTNEGQRVGQQIIMQNFDMRIAYRTVDATIGDNLMRIVLFYDDNNGESPDFQQMMNSGVTGTMPVSTFNIESTNEGVPKGFQSEKRYTILYDKVFRVNNTGGASDQPEAGYTRISFSLRKKVQYTASGVTDADILQNAFWLAAWSNTTNVVITDLSYRLLYTDA